MTKTNQYKACPTCFDHYRDIFRSELSRNQVILQNIHLRTEKTSGLCGVFDKTEAQRLNESHLHTSYVTMRSICCQGDKSLVPVSRMWLVIDPTFNQTFYMVRYMLCMHVGLVTDHVKRHDQNLRGKRGVGVPKI